MAKEKRKKRLLSESKLHDVKENAKKFNAFEMHVNRRKFNVVGMKSKTEKGLPFISRSRALKKRKETLLQEYKLKNKINTFADRRIGEKDTSMTFDDKIMARFTAERTKMHSKKSIFNLSDGEELTHRGETLTEIEKYDDPKSDDDFDDDQDGKLDANFVEEAHFGGGMFKKVEGESKSRKDVIDQLIAESKKRKAEKQKLREETLDLTQKLDSEWKELFPLITCSKKTDDNDNYDKDGRKDKKSTSYDILSKQLKFEARGKPGDRLKSEEEIAKEEKKKLEALEKERLDRMLGDNRKTVISHRSADDLDDGFVLDYQSDFVLSYNKEGMPIMENEDIDNEFQNGVILKKNSQEEIESDEESEDESDSGCEEGTDKILTDTGDVAEGVRNVDMDAETDNDENSDDSSNNLSDLKESITSEDEGEPEGQKLKGKQMLGSIKETYGNESESVREKEVEKLAYIIDIPNDYDSFEKLMPHSDIIIQKVVVERMIKCNHPSLSSSNKEKLDTLFTYLMQHLEDSTCELEMSSFKILDALSPFIYDLAQWNPDSCASAVLAVIKEKYQIFQNKCKVYPGIDTLIFLKLVGLLFSTSDYRHKIVTPTLTFMEHILSSCRVSNSIHLSTGLFISTLILEFTSFSKRFVPEVIHFIRGVLRLSHSKQFELPFYLPFREEDFDKFNLVTDGKCNTQRKLEETNLLVDDNSEEFKLSAICLSLQILSELCDKYASMNGAALIFEPLLPLLMHKQFNTCLKDSVLNCVKKISDMKSKSIERLVLERKRPKPLRLYEPRIEQMHCLKRTNSSMGAAKQERAKLQHKLKREMKGALREIRRDSSFLAKLKFKEMHKSDVERKRKVKDILGSVAQQTGEVRKMKRKK